MCASIVGVRDGMNLLCKLILELDELNGFHFAETEPRAKRHEIRDDFKSLVRIGVNFWIGHLNVQTAPRYTQKSD